MGDEAKKDSEGAKSGPSSTDSKFDTLLAAINSMTQKIDNLEKKSQSQEDWKAKMEAKLAGEVTNDEKSEGEKDSSEDARTEEETPAVETNNVSDSGNSNNVESESQNVSNEHRIKMS